VHVTIREAVEIARVRRLILSGHARKIRLDARLSLDELGRSIEVDGATVGRWEGGRLPRAAAALRYGQLLQELADMVQE
jgi:DNA-binding transcriptional regulator YiaG